MGAENFPIVLTGTVLYVFTVTVTSNQDVFVSWQFFFLLP